MATSLTALRNFSDDLPDGIFYLCVIQNFRSYIYQADIYIFTARATHIPQWLLIQPVCFTHAPFEKIADIRPFVIALRNRHHHRRLASNRCQRAPRLARRAARFTRSASRRTGALRRSQHDISQRIYKPALPLFKKRVNAASRLYPLRGGKGIGIFFQQVCYFFTSGRLFGAILSPGFFGTTFLAPPFTAPETAPFTAPETAPFAAPAPGPAPRRFSAFCCCA